MLELIITYSIVAIATGFLLKRIYQSLNFRSQMKSGCGNCGVQEKQTD